MSAPSDEALVRRAVAVATRLGGGGLAGIRRAFDRVGAADTFDTWVGHGANAPISAAVVAQAMPDAIAAMAVATRRDSAVLAQLLADALPQIVDELTPDGVLPAPVPRLWSRVRALWRGQR